MAKLMVCTICHTADKPKTKVKGSIFIEIILWLFLIVPGLVYSVWRHTGGTVKVCRHCGAETLVPATSPAGRRIIDTPL